MADSYVCKRCGMTGTKKEIGYKIIDVHDDKVVFKGQFCDKCIEEFLGRPHENEEVNNQTIK